ncbi:FMN-binding protein [Candidatus Omnitrophota bacterium]
MRREAHIVLVTLFLVFLSLSAAFCEGEKRYTDGVYEGEHSFVKVQVTVKGGNVDDIKMLYHGGGGEKYAEMVKPLLAEMVEKQSTNIDAITGATVSSDNLKKAVNNALEKARSD